MKNLILILAFIFCSCIAFAQDTIKVDQKITKNLVYMDYGAGYFDAHVAMNYERTIYTHSGSNFSLNGGYGIYSYLIPTGDFYSISAHYSYGKRF